MPAGTVLVTGASTGIGESTARHLRELGFDVVAGVRKDEDAERLGAAGLQTVKLDVTDCGPGRCPASAIRATAASRAS